MYKHRTSNELFFDKIRELQFELDLLRAYLSNSTGYDKLAYNKEEQALNLCSLILFDDVYKSIREKWS